MYLPGKVLAYFYALALSLGTLGGFQGAMPFSAEQLQDWPGSTEKIDASEHCDPGYIISENNQAYSFSYNSSGERDTLNFFKTGGLYYFFLNNIYDTAFTLSKIHEINFKSIDLIYPFHYFW